MSDIGIQNPGGEQSKAPREQTMSLNDQERKKLTVILVVGVVIGLLGVGVVGLGISSNPDQMTRLTQPNKGANYLTPGRP